MSPRLSLPPLALLLAACSTTQAIHAEEPPTRTSAPRGGRFVLADAAEGRAVLGARDEFIAALGPFDRGGRLETDREVSEQELLAFVGAQALDWPASDARLATAATRQLEERLAEVVPGLPGLDRVALVRTTGREEGGAPHTRGHAIVLPAGELEHTDARRLAGLLAHETFHVLSRHLRASDPAAVDALYALVGFEDVGEVELPPDIAPLRVTNPDAPTRRHAIEITLADGARARVVPVLYAPSGYDPAVGGPFFRHMALRLMEVVPGHGARLDEAGHAVSYDLAGTSYGAQAALNTELAIHPEEVLADNFANLLFGFDDVAHPELLVALREQLIRIAADSSRGAAPPSPTAAKPGPNPIPSPTALRTFGPEPPRGAPG
ncbi:MAG: hypothetical protein KC619_24445, partial [Myxococcales bacterium]|nr:hypothetical protein [Myxococcales bacterium]